MAVEPNWYRLERSHDRPHGPDTPAVGPDGSAALRNMGIRQLGRMPGVDQFRAGCFAARPVHAKGRPPNGLTRLDRMDQILFEKGCKDTFGSEGQVVIPKSGLKSGLSAQSWIFAGPLGPSGPCGLSGLPPSSTSRTGDPCSFEPLSRYGEHL
jgi:hypothetical protein